MIRDQPFGPVFGNDGNAVAGFHAQCAQSAGQLGDLDRHLGPAQRLPAAFLFAPQKRFVAKSRHLAKQHRHDIGPIIGMFCCLLPHLLIDPISGFGFG